MSSVSDGGQPELELSDDPYDGRRLETGSCPLLVTLARVGNHCVADPTPEEEACSSSSLVVGVAPDGRVSAIRKLGAGGFHPETAREALEAASELGKTVQAELARRLEEDERRRAEEDLCDLPSQEEGGFLA